MKHASNTLLLANRYGQIRRVTYNPLHTGLLVLAAIIAISGSILYSGYHAGVIAEARQQLSEVAVLRTQLQQQQTRITRVQKTALNNLDALTLRLGRMQAQMLRLDALGERLVQQADLDARQSAPTSPAESPPTDGQQQAAPARDQQRDQHFVSRPRHQGVLGGWRQRARSKGGRQPDHALGLDHQEQCHDRQGRRRDGGQQHGNIQSPALPCRIS